MKKRQHKKPSGLSFLQFALLSPITRPDADLNLKVNPAAVILSAEEAYRAAGWTPAQAKAETRPRGCRGARR